MAVFLLLLMASIYKEKLNFMNSSQGFQRELVLNVTSRGIPGPSAFPPLPAVLQGPHQSLCPSFRWWPWSLPVPRDIFLYSFLPEASPFPSPVSVLFTFRSSIAFPSFREKLDPNQTTTWFSCPPSGGVLCVSPAAPPSPRVVARGARWEG